MALTRKLIDWTLPPLASAVEFLSSRYLKNGMFDLTPAIIVLPTRRACRQLLKQLAAFAEKQSFVLQLPKIVTTGQFPELLYSAQRPFAPELTQKFAWASALKTLRRSGARFFDPPSDENAMIAWLDLADLFYRTHREIAANGMDFRDIIDAGQKIPGFMEVARWKFFYRVQQKYLEILDEQGVWDAQTARQVAVKKKECSTDKDIVLIGTVDLNRSMIQMLEQVADRVTSFVFAPQELSDRFDHFGCLLANHWDHARIGVDEKQVTLVEGPEDQAAYLVKLLDENQSNFSAAEVSIGVGDSTMIQELESRLEKASIATHWSGGIPLSETQPFQLIHALAAYVEGRRFYEFASLIRHVAMTQWIEYHVFGRKTDGKTDDAADFHFDWLTQLDRYFQNHLQPKLGYWLGDRSGHAEIRKIHGAVEDVIAPLIRPKYRPANEWAGILAQVLGEFYQAVELDEDDANDQKSIAALQKIRETLFEIRSIPDSVSPSTSASETLQLLLNRLQNESISAERTERAVELLGWLELALDDAPLTVVSSMNDEVIPQSHNSDVMLPNALRSKLRLTDNASRFARDNYFLNVLVAGRKQLQLIVARRNRDGDPLTPSRLLFATEREKIPQRVLTWFGAGQQFEIETEADQNSESLNDETPKEETPKKQIVVPKPKLYEQPLKSISVTAFRNYLACPYYFYLKHVEKLEPLDDQMNELSPPSFGNAIHDVLENFGNSEIKDSTNAKQIRDFLAEELDRYYLRMFGKVTMPAVDIQKGQSMQRLSVFADWQADWASQGWTIQHTEIIAEGVTIDLDDGRNIELRGRIDRVDYHSQTGVTAILDYKTGDKDTSPKKKHQDSEGNWTDLQLPLYRHIARQLKLPEPYRFGYIAIPKDLSLLDAYFADWSDQELDDAMMAAKQVVEKVLDQKFWPMETEHRYRKDFESICQDGVLDRLVEV